MKGIRILPRFSIFVLTFLWLGISACNSPQDSHESDATQNDTQQDGPQPTSDTSDIVSNCTVDASEVVGTLSALNGVQGAPAAMNESDSDLVAQYAEAQINIVRVPQDDSPEYSLSGIFPNPNAPVEEPSSYNFEAIDRLIELIVESGATPLWQATVNIGADTDTYWAECLQTGSAPTDSVTWGAVVRHVLMHFNEGWAEGHHWNVRYVESINEPFKTGVYEREDYLSCWQAFAALSTAVEDYNSEYSRDVMVVGFANPVDINTRDQERFDNDIWLVEDFLTFVQDNDLSLDVFSYHNYGSASNQAETAEVVRSVLDDAGFVDLPLWNSEWNVGSRGVEKGDDDDLQGSAYIAAHNAQVKTYFQGVVDEALVYRANQRTHFQGCTSDDTFYLSTRGQPQPAYYGWLMFRDLANETPNRLAAETELDDVTILVGRSDLTDTIGVLLSFWLEDPAPVPAEHYVISITGLVAGTRYHGELRMLDVDTSAYEPYREANFSVQPNGELLISGEMYQSSLHFWMLTLL